MLALGPFSAGEVALVVALGFLAFLIGLGFCHVIGGILRAAKRRREPDDPKG